MKTRTLYLLLLSLFFGAFSGAAQSRSLTDRVLRSVTKHEKQWSLTDNTTLEGAALVGFDPSYMEWLAGKSRVDVLIYA